MQNNQPKKILYLITQSKWGGAQAYIFDLASYLKNNKKFQVAVAVGEDKNGELIKRLLKLGIKTYYIKNLKQKINFYNDWLAFWSITKLCRQIKPDIIHLNSSKAGSLGAIAAKFANIKKIIYTVHGLVLNENLTLFKKIFYWLAEWLSSKFKHYLICVSEFDQKSLLKYKIAPMHKISVIHNGIDLPNLAFLSKQEAIKKIETLTNYDLQPASYKLIGTIANFYPNKGLIYLIEAARQIKQIEHKIKFIIIGDGEDRDKLEKLIHNYQLSQTVFLTGRIANSRQYLKAFDTFVLPSIKEGFAYSLIEASAAGLPIIATNVGGNPEIINHNKTGLLTPAADYNSLAETIINLSQDREKAFKLGQNATLKAKQFSLGQMIAQTLDIYDK